MILLKDKVVYEPSNLKNTNFQKGFEILAITVCHVREESKFRKATK